MSKIRIILAKNIKRYRGILGITQMELAEKVGCSPTLIGKIETMKRFPSAENLDRFSEALKITPADLFTEEDKSETAKFRASQQKRKTQLKTKILKAIDEAF